MKRTSIVHGQQTIVRSLFFITTLLWTVVCGLSSCTTKDPKFQQYFAQGQTLYEKHCSNCHQKNGQGLGRVYPPLASSDFFGKNLNASLCIMKYGIQGEIIVNGKSFNKPMPGVPSLTELEIAEIATYIGNSWNHQMGLIDVAQTAKVIAACQR
jgi:mono/diheme cytochrome c family protein